LSGSSRDDVAKAFDGKFPFRMKEVEVLVKNGYTFEIDEVNQVIHWLKPK
jgi:hypothetical protein